MKTFFLLSFLGFCSITCFCQTYTTSSNVEILEGHTWYAGKILEVKGEQYKIHYSMYDNNLWDIWVGKERLRPVGTKNTAPVNNKSVSGDGVLYTGSSATGGSVYLYLYPSGHVVMGCPTGGLEKFNYNSFCAAGKNSCGTFTKTGSTINITWSAGYTWKGIIKPNGDMEINNSLLGPVQKVPNKLSANYEFSVNTNGASVAEVISFKDDGTYVVSRVSGYDHNDGKNSAEGQSTNKGKYVINGFTISMTDNTGKTSSYTIYALDNKKNPDDLGWDGNFLTKSRK